jgi:hypothetical protein
VPWHEVKTETDKAKQKTPSVQAPAGGWKLSGKDSVIREFVPCPFVQFSHERPPVDGTDDIFGDPDEVCIVLGDTRR